MVVVLPVPCPQVVELGGSRVLLVAVEDDVYAVSNKCSHLGLPIVGEWCVQQQVCLVGRQLVVCVTHNPHTAAVAVTVAGQVPLCADCDSDTTCSCC